MTTKEQLAELLDNVDEETARKAIPHIELLLRALANDDDPSPELMTWYAAVGGAFDWLDDEPDIYTLEDGEPI